MEKQALTCPACGSSATYRYGRTINGKKRRICMLCNRQYVVDGPRRNDTLRPNCPVCNQPMHRYMQKKGFIRYRCSNYPRCRTYLRVDRPNEPNRSSPANGMASQTLSYLK
ncbi:topoisomerase DNA-binding C4 zinc finger domain-containing protein [uncultured Desulfosarcina sp.]|uniref:IS1/IS1595 family N-terminal zinc-binding domain-containing protein n=1 Tax=uncultured Desulfosarcina sp. TaxID=218289 RepID=UPI0029C81D97|nr:topoisomerase DNA-binding C4 zinc finger domain-containing protein [uncultured Desulfosarcina sp.]